MQGDCGDCGVRGDRLPRALRGKREGARLEHAGSKARGPRSGWPINNIPWGQTIAYRQVLAVKLNLPIQTFYARALDYGRQ